jgi:DegV family protein with EDD domain
MTDTVAGIPGELAQEYRITVVPAANIVFNGHTYLDGVTIKATEAYQLLRKDPDRFSTSAVSPSYILEAYRKLAATSRDILFVTVSSALSAVSKSAALAADIFQEESPDTTVRILDSRTVASGQGLVVLAAARAAVQGANLDEVADIAQRVRQKTGNYMLLDTLRYAYRTGRISKTSARIAAMLGIKPITCVSDEGKVDFIGKTRSREAGIKRMLKLIKEEAGVEALHFWVMHADAPKAAQELAERLKQEFNCLSMVISEYSPVMGYGAGPGALSVGFHPELALSSQ